MAKKYLKDRNKEKILYFIKMFFVFIIVCLSVTVTVLQFKIYGVIAILIFMVIYLFFSSERHY